MRDEHPVGRYVGILHRYSRMHFSRAVETLGLTEPTLPYLMRLFRDDALSQDELARFHHCDKATAARATARLEDTGFVTRTQDPADKRIKRVKLTAKARRIEPQLAAIFADWSRTLTAGFSRQERDLAMNLLERMAKNAQRAVHDATGDAPLARRQRQTAARGGLRR